MNWGEHNRNEQEEGRAEDEEAEEDAVEKALPGIGRIVSSELSASFGSG